MAPAAFAPLPTTPAKTTHVLSVTFTVDLHCDDHIQTPDAIRNEALTWLRHMGADIQRIDVRAAR